MSMWSGALADFFLDEEEGRVEEYDRHETADGTELVLPVSDRKPSDAGFVLTWREQRTGGKPRQRTGVVLSKAPRPNAVWVVPDERRRGEGYAVLVYVVVNDGQVDAERTIGGPCDHMSAARWQTPRRLPRAYIRVDALLDGEGAVTYETARLHADPACPVPKWVHGVDRIRRGKARRLEATYVYDGYLHPVSTVPTDPVAPERFARPLVSLCGTCLKRGQPPT